MTHGVVFLLDVDNTLLDNDRVVDDLRGHLVRAIGSKSADRYWALFEQLRTELGYADYLGALQRYRVETMHDTAPDPVLLQLSSYLIDYPFADRLYPGALRALEHLRRFGLTAILSDGRVMIYIHKERMLDAVQQRFPARHYVMVDDKLRLLTAMKQTLGARLTTVFVRQGHYALDPHSSVAYAPADITLQRIADLASVGLPDLLGQRAVHIPPKETP